MMNMTRNANARITLQATQKNKVNFFWDEGLTCQDPCNGSVAPWTARDGWWSGQVHPARLMQAVVDESADERDPARSGSVSEPATLRLLAASLLHAQSGHSTCGRVRNDSRRGCRVTGPQHVRISPLFGVPSGPWADGIGGAAEQRNLNDWRPRASISYVTGQHNAKFGYDGGYFAQTRTNRTGNTRLEYRYLHAATPTGDNLLQRRQSGGVDLRQHEPLLPERPVQPGAPAGARSRSTSIPGRPPSITGWATPASTRRISGR